MKACAEHEPPLGDRVDELLRTLKPILGPGCTLGALRQLTLAIDRKLPTWLLVRTARREQDWSGWEVRIGAAVDRARARAHREEGSR